MTPNANRLKVNVRGMSRKWKWIVTLGVMLGSVSCYEVVAPPKPAPKVPDPVVTGRSQDLPPANPVVSVQQSTTAPQDSIVTTEVITTPEVPVIPLEYFGLHIHKADNGTAWPAVSFGSWRLWDAYVQWAHLQPSRGTWDFTRLDKYVALAESHKVTVLLPFGLSPRWASARPNESSSYGQGNAAEPALIEDWRVYVRTVAQRYKGRISTFEIWNEPNDKTFFSGSTAKLVELTCEAYRILKAIDPAILLVSPAYTGEENAPKLEDFLAKGGGKCIDVVAYHLYVPTNPPEAIIPVIEQVKLAMTRQGLDRLPLWNTENGWIFDNTDGTPEESLPTDWLRVSSPLSAAFVTRAYILASAFGIDRYYWYSWDGGSLGLLEPTAKVPKPGGLAVGVVASWMTGSPRPVCTDVDTMWQCVLSASAIEQRIVVWSPGNPRTFVAPAGWKIQKSERADSRTESTALPSSSIRTSQLPRLLVMVPDTPL